MLPDSLIQNKLDTIEAHFEMGLKKCRELKQQLSGKEEKKGLSKYTEAKLLANRQAKRKRA